MCRVELSDRCSFRVFSAGSCSAQSFSPCPISARRPSRAKGLSCHTLFAVVPNWLAKLLLAGAVIAQYFCGLATVTSASRMAFAFARDGGLPASTWVRWVSPTFRTPPVAIWGVALAALLFTVSTPVYATITVVCVIFLYVSYVLPTAIGILAYGRWWTNFGPWQLGARLPTAGGHQRRQQPRADRHRHAAAQHQSGLRGRGDDRRLNGVVVYPRGTTSPAHPTAS